MSVQVDNSNLPQVTLYVSVSDASGQPVTDLVRENFHRMKKVVQNAALCYPYIVDIQAALPTDEGGH